MIKNILFLLFLIAFFIHPGFSQSNLKKLGKMPAFPKCYASGKIEKAYVLPPADFLLKSSNSSKSDIIVEYSLFPDDAKAAFEYAVGIWESIVQSDVPIHITANWRSDEENVLGSAGTTTYYTGFENLPRKDLYYPVALAERLSKKELNGATVPDIISTFNKDIDWYFGTDGNTPDSLYDFVTVVLHEIAHGLGFTGLFYAFDNIGSYDYNGLFGAAPFDYLVRDNDGNNLLDTTLYPLFSEALYEAFVSEALYANSPTAHALSNGETIRLYAPPEFDSGSSIYHLNTADYPNSLMTHSIGQAEAIHNPGNLVRGILSDLGWDHMFIEFDNPKDIEQPEPIDFNIAINSDFGVDTSSLYLIYSYDGFENQIDSLKLLPDSENNQYTGQLFPGAGSDTLNYYISALDTFNRNFTLPTEAPEDLFRLTIGPDNEAPVISHDSIPYFILQDKALEISTLVEDNLGVDTVFVEYKINGVVQTPFGLNSKSTSNYSGFFGFNPELLKDGDEVEYRIIAFDSSTSENQNSYPAEGFLNFRIEKIFAPQVRYVSDFSQAQSDFVLFDFDIYKETNFESVALHSPHPYPSPRQDNTTWNFSTLLKYPIILLEESTLSFDEVVLVEPGEPLSNFNDDDFWDYVIVEGSKDKGETWLPVADGYDSGYRQVWDDAYNLDFSGQTSNTEGTPELFVRREIDMLANGNFAVGDTILVRFRLFSDPYANGWGWTIDNLKIQIPVSAKEPLTAMESINVYPNPFNDVFYLNIQTKENFGELRIDIYNAFGQKMNSMLSKNIIGNFVQQIDMRNYSNGLYFITIEKNHKHIYSSRIIKQ